MLIDGATGNEANCVVERVVLGHWACLGCTWTGPPVPEQNRDGNVGECATFPDNTARSVSFLSALPGILAAGEIVKEALGADGSLRGV